LNLPKKFSPSRFNPSATTPLLSVVIPIFNEADNIELLLNEIKVALANSLTYEIIVVDDGSHDASWQCLQDLAKKSVQSVKILRHQRCYGQSVAILTGVKAAQAPWIATLDGDGQNDPADILHLVTALAESKNNVNIQLIAGFRRQRQDRWLKRISSHLANKIRRWLLRDNTMDTGCGLKLFSREAFLTLPHFNHMHRFLPALFLRQGGEVITVAVNHRPRQRGNSKYGLFDRLWVGIVDLFGVMWLQRRTCRAEIVEDSVSNDE
jgi:dolichol-phosphate mannosyltransferase